jgi:hypothetical protein
MDFVGEGKMVDLLDGPVGAPLLHELLDLLGERIGRDVHDVVGGNRSMGLGMREREAPGARADGRVHGVGPDVV